MTSLNISFLRCARNGNSLRTCFDIMVDGKFIEEEKDLNLKFRGSRNQRIIDVQKSLATGELVLWDEKGAFF